ncbi:6-phosphogluconolactonase [Aureimonas jatrophae]|uniref:6-phosphogluconolactonase n=1 Tax=Aureimonas jatrophae TaxID=1166073 RepID=A0A1H0L3G2_9HYPH|nr:6-phosphogluconolactonase [Aureimonas jatrophae]MBB3952388.1 6-phosphogluconolactonase [Aureimonas jatrophae]SDO62576.1 6-phosphogluconolactonase [Aureimonas jatrophae]
MLKRHEYETREALAEALSAGVAAVLAGGIATRGEAVLAVSGGSTPKLFFQHLSRTEIDWSRVTVLLVDERWVPETSDRSNARLLRENLLQGPAGAARTELFFQEGESAEEAEASLSRRFAALPRPLDVVVLGMGDDGHTASFFPGGDRLPEAIDPANPAAVVPMRAPGATEPRVTLTLSRLADARLLAVHIEGENKRATLERALGGTDTAEMPVRAVFGLERETPIELFWAP